TGRGAGTGAATGGAQPSLADLIALLGGGAAGGGAAGTGTTPAPRRDAGVRGGGGVTMPTAEQCKAPADQVQQFLCMLQTQMNAQNGAAVDAGAPPVIR
ncbi:MAG: hypothetical protein JWN48_2527, partial [Myxococcaceae bacterium]|nr:hypothetical protein [Myxococcaceae bacterium]